jgi:hypothetical protein
MKNDPSGSRGVVRTAIMIGINLSAFLLARIVYLEIHRL